jgi:hypothetical protein
MVQASAAYAALTKMYGQTVNWKSDEPENLFLKMKEDGSLTFEKRGFGISVWFSRKVVPWFSRVIFRRPETHEYDFAENLDAFRKLILEAVSDVQTSSVGKEGAETIEKMIEIYNGLVGGTTRGVQGTRLRRFVAARSGNISLCQPISAEEVLERAAEASTQDQTLMKTVRASFSCLFPEAQAQPESKAKGGSDPRLSLAIKLVVQGTSERTNVAQAHGELEARVRSIQDAHPSPEILGGECFKKAVSLASGRPPASTMPSPKSVSDTEMVSYLGKVSASLVAVEQQVSDKKREELGQLHQAFDQLAREFEQKNTEAGEVHFGKLLDSAPLSSVDRTLPSTILEMDKKVIELKVLQEKQRGLISTFDEELQSFKKLQSDLKAKIEELQRYAKKGPTAEIVADRWIEELREKQEFLHTKGYEALQGVQEALSQYSTDAFKAAVQDELTQQQRNVEETVRPLLSSPKGIVESLVGAAAQGLKALGSIVVGKDIDGEIKTLSSQWYQQAKLYAYAERALARYKCLRELVNKWPIDLLPVVDTKPAESLVQKWRSNPTVQPDKTDIAALFRCFCELEEANTLMQAGLETLPKQDESLQYALEVLHGFDRLVQVQEKINVLSPIFADDRLWSQHKPETVLSMRQRFLGFVNSLERSVQTMKKRLPLDRPLVPKKQGLEEVDSICGEEEREVKVYLGTEGAGVWEAWIKFRSQTIKEKIAAEEALDLFLKKNAEERSLFIARTILAG